MAKSLYGGDPAMPKSVSDNLNKKTGMNSNVAKNPGQISGLATSNNIKAWGSWASANSGGRDYSASDFRDSGNLGKPPRSGR